MCACVLDGVVGEFDFPTVHCFDASHSLQQEGHIAINCIVASLVGW